MQHGDVFAEHYRIVRELGRGGMGVVYQALDENLGRDVALKVMALSARHDPSAAGRFRREAQVLAALHHPGVVTVHDYGESDGQLFLVMRLVNGIDLARRLSDSRRLTPAHTVALAEQVAVALDALHENRLVHRDVKPSNILLEGDEQHPVLCDFGLAKPVDGSLSLTTAGTTVGTVQYMAPEQLGGDRGTPASDVYAFGCVLYHCLTGQPPFPGTDPYEIAAAHRGHPVPDARSLQPDLPVGVPPALVAAWPSRRRSAGRPRARRPVRSGRRRRPRRRPRHVRRRARSRRPSSRARPLFPDRARSRCPHDGWRSLGFGFPGCWWAWSSWSSRVLWAFSSAPRRMSRTPGRPPPPAPRRRGSTRRTGGSPRCCARSTAGAPRSRGCLGSWRG